MALSPKDRSAAPHVPSGAGSRRPPPDAGAGAARPRATPPTCRTRRNAPPPAPAGVRLLARIYEIFPMVCPDSGADMRILAFITAAEPVDAILSHLGLPTTPPPLSRRAARPTTSAWTTDPGFDFDQTPTYDLTEPEPVPGFDFDQSARA